MSRRDAEKRRSEARPGSQSQVLPPYKVLLHNDNVHEMDYVVQAIMEVARLPKPEATERMLEAHHRGVALLLVTHRERAELFVEQFACKGLIVTIEPA
ncbi:MAG: ATP-dependent Clp protease adaptor ClpS [Gemmataceae bacterium]